MILYFQHRRQVQPFSFAVIFLSLVITVLESRHLIICFLFFLKTELLAFEAGSSSAQLQGVSSYCDASKESSQGSGCCHTDLRWMGPSGPGLWRTCLRSGFRGTSSLLPSSFPLSPAPSPLPSPAKMQLDSEDKTVYLAPQIKTFTFCRFKLCPWHNTIGTNGKSLSWEFNVFHGAVVAGRGLLMVSKFI